MGVTEEEKPVSDVELPPWAKSAEDFVRINRTVNQHAVFRQIVAHVLIKAHPYLSADLITLCASTYKDFIGKLRTFLVMYVFFPYFS